MKKYTFEKGMGGVTIIMIAAIVLLVIGVAYYATLPTTPTNTHAAGNNENDQVAKQVSPTPNVSPQPSPIMNSNDLDNAEQDLDNTDTSQADTDLNQLSNSQL